MVRHRGDSATHRLYRGGLGSKVRMSEFRSQLQEIEKRLPGRTSWPFLCRGSPLRRRRIFIVGATPASQVKKPFWDNFWTDSRGFKRDKFIQELKELPGGLKTTRDNIEIVVAVAGINDTLETNLYPYKAGRVTDLKPEQMRTDILEFLLYTVKPRVVLAHGGEAKKFFSKHCCGFVADSVTPRQVTWDSWQWHFQLLCSHHLSFQGKKGTHAENAKTIGRALAKALH